MDILSSVILEVNGQTIDDFKSVTEGEREYRKPVKLMKKTGFVTVTPNHTVKVDYAVPATGEFNWAEVQEGRLTLEFENGKRVTYTGVCTLKEGEMKIDGGDDGTIKEIELGAKKRIEE